MRELRLRGAPRRRDGILRTCVVSDPAARLTREETI